LAGLLGGITEEDFAAGARLDNRTDRQQALGYLNSYYTSFFFMNIINYLREISSGAARLAPSSRVDYYAWIYLKEDFWQPK
jgi:hypothetical protein